MYRVSTVFAFALVCGCGGLVDRDAEPSDVGDANGAGSGSGGELPVRSEPWWCATCPADYLRLISATPNGSPGNGFSQHPTLSTDGSTIAFSSSSTDLVDGDTNDAFDILIYSFDSGTITRIVGEQGVEGNGDSTSSHASGDGRLVAFVSEATNLVEGDTNGFADVFVASEGVVSALVSKATDDTPANGPSAAPRISANGRYVLFASDADNLVNGDTNGATDIFLRDLHLGTTERVSLTVDGLEGDGPSTSGDVSGDGRYVIFTSAATNLLPNDTNGVPDVFLLDRTSGSLTLVSRGTDGASNGDSFVPVFSDDSSFIVFGSWAMNLPTGEVIDAITFEHRSGGYLYGSDRTTLGMQLLSQGASGPAERPASGPEVSADGAVVVFFSYAEHLAEGDDWVRGAGTLAVFARDTRNARTTLVSRGIDGGRCDHHADGPTVSGNGKRIAFSAIAGNLGYGLLDTPQIFVAIGDGR